MRAPPLMPPCRSAYSSISLSGIDRAVPLGDESCVWDIDHVYVKRRAEPIVRRFIWKSTVCHGSRMGKFRDISDINLNSAHDSCYRAVALFRCCQKVAPHTHRRIHNVVLCRDFLATLLHCNNAERAEQSLPRCRDHECRPRPVRESNRFGVEARPVIDCGRPR